MQLHLKRFEYDPVRDSMAKMHDRYAFPTSLDLRPFLHQPSAGQPGAPEPVYQLHSVLVHSGGMHGGHYYAYIRPSAAPGGAWFKFDDERVTREQEHCAVADNFGDADGGHGTWRCRVSSAYMLVYVRAADAGAVLAPPGPEYAPHVLHRQAAETAERERKLKERAEAHLYSVVRVARDADVGAHCASSAPFDVVDFDAPSLLQLRTLRTTPFAEFKAAVAERTGVPPAAQRWWAWAKRENGTFRPSAALTPADEAKTIAGLHPVAEQRGKRDAAPDGGYMLFLEAPGWPAAAGGAAAAGPPPPPPPLRRGELLLFVKLYDPVAGVLRYAGRALVGEATRVGDLRSALAARGLALPPGELEFCEELRTEPIVAVDPLDPAATLQSAELETGDILVAQPLLTPAQAARVRHATAQQHLEWVRNRLVVQFRPLPGAADTGTAAPGAGRSEAVRLELQRGASYDEVTSALAEHLRLGDPQLLRLTGASAHTGQPLARAVPFGEKGTLAELLGHTDALYFEILARAPVFVVL